MYLNNHAIEQSSLDLPHTRYGVRSIVSNNHELGPLLAGLVHFWQKNLDPQSIFLPKMSSFCPVQFWRDTTTTSALYQLLSNSLACGSHLVLLVGNINMTMLISHT